MTETTSPGRNLVPEIHNVLSWLFLDKECANVTHVKACILYVCIYIYMYVCSLDSGEAVSIYLSIYIYSSSLYIYIFIHSWIY